MTIHYANPLERSHRARSQLFRSQHHFALAPSPFDAAIDGAIDDDAWRSVEPLEERLERWEAGFDPSEGGAAEALAEAGECLRLALGVLPPTHLVVMRAHKAVVAAAQALIAVRTPLASVCSDLCLTPPP